MPLVTNTNPGALEQGRDKDVASRRGRALGSSRSLITLLFKVMRQITKDFSQLPSFFPFFPFVLFSPPCLPASFSGHCSLLSIRQPVTPIKFKSDHDTLNQNMPPKPLNSQASLLCFPHHHLFCKTLEAFRNSIWLIYDAYCLLPISAGM